MPGSTTRVFSLQIEPVTGSFFLIALPAAPVPVVILPVIVVRFHAVFLCVFGSVVVPFGHLPSPFASLNWMVALLVPCFEAQVIVSWIEPVPSAQTNRTSQQRIAGT